LEVPRLSHPQLKTRLLDLSPREHRAADDPLSGESSIALTELKGRDFLGIDKTEMPGRNPCSAILCRSAGFKSRIVASVDGVTHLLSRIVSESSLTLLPDLFPRRFPSGRGLSED